MIRKLNPHLNKPNCEPVYDSLYNIVPFSISTAYPYDSLNEFRPSIRKPYILDVELKNKKLKFITNKSSEIENENFLSSIYTAIHFFKTEQNIDEAIIKYIKKYLARKLDKITYNYLLVCLSKISGKIYIDTWDIDQYIQNCDEEENRINKVFNFIIAEWLSVILYNKIKNEFDKIILGSKKENNKIFKQIYNPLQRKYIINIIERDMFNGIFDIKNILFLSLIKKDNTIFENKPILNKFLNYSLAYELFDKKDLIKLKFKFKKTNMDFETVKKKYKEFMEIFFKSIPFDKKSILFSVNEEINRNITLDIKNNNIIFLSESEFLSLIKKYDNDIEFINKLLFMLLYICNHLTYPMETIVSTFIIISDLIHLNKNKINRVYLSYFLLTIKKSMYTIGIINKIFNIPILQLKILIFLNDIWDILINENISYNDEDFYIIKEIISYFENIMLFKQYYLNESESLNYLYYFLLFKNTVRKYFLHKNEYKALKQFELILNGVKNKELKEKTQKCLNYCKFKTGMDYEN